MCRKQYAVMKDERRAYRAFYNPRILSGASSKPRLTKTIRKRTVCKRRSRTVAILPRLDRCSVARNQSLREPFIHGPSLFQQPSGSHPGSGILAPVSGTGCCWRVKVGTIYTLAENPGEISHFECLGGPRGISGRLARVQATVHVTGETIGIIKYSA